MIEKGFTLKCNSCGKEVQLRIEDWRIVYYDKSMSEISHDIYMWADVCQTIEIRCECGNYIEEI